MSIRAGISQEEFARQAEAGPLPPGLLTRGAWQGFSGREFSPHEEVEQQRSAFTANSRTAAARRMRLYLLQAGNGVISAALSDMDALDRAADREAVVTAAEALQHSYALKDVVSTLNEIVDFYNRHRSEISGLLSDIEREYERLTEDLAGKEEEVAAGEERTQVCRIAVSGTRAKVETAIAAVTRAERGVFAANGILSGLENGAIKIVRPYNNIFEFRAGLRAQETDAPEIYVLAGATPDGSPLYDRITLGAEGVVNIERVGASEAPPVMKEDGVMASDMVERVFYRDGELVRVENGANGSLFGPIGTVSGYMLAQYLDATGLRTKDITPAAAAFEEKNAAQDTQIDTHAEAYRNKWESEEQYEHAKQDLAQAVEALNLRREELAVLEGRACRCRERREELREELRETERLIAAAANYQLLLANGLITSLDELMERMPEGLKQQYISSHMHEAETTGPQSRLGAAWAKIMTLPAANDAPAGDPDSDFEIAVPGPAMGLNGPMPH